MTRSQVLPALFLVLGIAFASRVPVAAAPDETAAAPTSDEAVPRVHEDPWAVEDAMVAAYRAKLRDDVEALAAALETVAAGCRRLTAADDERLKPLRGVDRGFHEAADRALEQARKGDLAKAADDHYWMTVGCRRCHVQARKAGILPNEPLSPER